MFGFGTLYDFLSAQIIPIGLLLAFIAIGLLTLFLVGTYRHRRLMQDRAGEDVETFVDYLAPFGFNSAIARSAYEYLVTEEEIAFPIHATDRFDRDLRISDEEVERMAAYLVIRHARQAMAGMRPLPLITVEDMLRYVQGCPPIDIYRSSSAYRIPSEVAGTKAS